MDAVGDPVAHASPIVRKSTKVQTLGAKACARGFEKAHALTKMQWKTAKQKTETRMAKTLVAHCLTIAGSL